MKLFNLKTYIVFFILSFLMSSCQTNISIQKRHYRKGIHIQINNSRTTAKKQTKVLNNSTTSHSFDEVEKKDTTIFEAPIKKIPSQNIVKNTRTKSTLKNKEERNKSLIREKRNNPIQLFSKNVFHKKDDDDDDYVREEEKSHGFWARFIVSLCIIGIGLPPPLAVGVSMGFKSKQFLNSLLIYLLTIGAFIGLSFLIVTYYNLPGIIILLGMQVFFGLFILGVIYALVWTIKSYRIYRLRQLENENS